MFKKFGIISYPDSSNIGDEIQSLAASKLLAKVDYLVPRSEINTFETRNKEQVHLICNGWFTPNLTAWPPNKCINPLFISFHATASNGSDKELISEKYFDYYKKHEPIGCRDEDTMKKFSSLGINAYFSGCLTLTLDNPFGKTVKRDEILIVDPFYRFDYDQAYMDYCLDMLVPEKYKSKIRIISHGSEHLKGLSVADKFKEAEELLRSYANAKMVITSRIHCALPCLAMGTPVYFIDIGYNAVHQRDRFKGVIDLFNVIDDHYFPLSKKIWYYYPFRKLGLYKLMKNSGKEIPIDWEKPAKNPDRYKVIRKKLKEKVKEFIKN